MFRTIELYLGAALLAAVIILCGLVYTQHKRLQAADSTERVLTGDAKAHQTYAAGSKELAAKEKAADAELEQALEANRSWADESVPDDVARSLCHGADAACGVPAADTDHPAQGADDQR